MFVNELEPDHHPDHHRIAELEAILLYLLSSFQILCMFFCWLAWLLFGLQ